MFRKSHMILKLSGLITVASAIAIKSRDEDIGNWPRALPKTVPCQSPVVQNKFETAIIKSRYLIKQFKEEVGTPGLVIGVSVNGVNVWTEGIGYSDLENLVECSPDSVMRIASISKSITMAAVAKLWEEGKLDLDKPVQEYVPSFPEKTYNGEKVAITSRHLVSHTSGIRHYKKPKDKKDDKGTAISNQTEPEEDKEMDLKEYFIKDNYASVLEALKLFKDDPLSFKPGTSYLYTTHGFTLLSAVVEAVVQTPFDKYITQLFKDLGMHHTFLDVHERIILHRARFYKKDKAGRIVNTPYVDNSYKWAGGGFLSTVSDLTHFGNLMLYSYQKGPAAENSKTMEDPSLKGYIKRETVEMLWTPVPVTKVNTTDSYYGMGWGVVPSNNTCRFCNDQRQVIAHSGGAIGASSILVIMPQRGSIIQQNDSKSLPQGVVVAIIVNLQEVNLGKLAIEIAKFFDEESLNVSLLPV